MILNYNEETGELASVGGDLKLDCLRARPATPLPADHELQRAVTIGRQVLDRISEGERSRERFEITDVAWSAPMQIGVYLKHPKPGPLKGLPWLKSLAVGTRILFPANRKAIITAKGIFWVADSTFLLWEHSEGPCLLSEACPATCPEWTP